MSRRLKWKLDHPYFTHILEQRPEIRVEWCIRTVEKPLRIEPQQNGRTRYWAKIDEFGGRFLRVVVLEDKVTLFNAFFDRKFKL
jgi:hypothetical protein